MTTLVGPAWSALGLTYAAPRYPLRVETHMLRLVNRLSPGVITTTARYSRNRSSPGIGLG